MDRFLLQLPQVGEISKGYDIVLFYIKKLHGLQILSSL